MLQSAVSSRSDTTASSRNGQKGGEKDVESVLLEGARRLVRFLALRREEKWGEAVKEIQSSPLFPFSAGHEPSLSVAAYPPELLSALPHVLTCYMRCVAALWYKLQDEFFVKRTLDPSSATNTGRVYESWARRALDFAATLELHMPSPIRDQLFQDVADLLSARI